MLAIRLLISLYILNLGYQFEGSFTPLKNFLFVSDLFRGSHANAQTANRFTDTLVGEFPVPLPRNYLLGIDIQQRDFEEYGQPSYLCGQWSERGWWYYYIYACAIKVPLGLWLLGFLVLGTRLIGAPSCSRPGSKPERFRDQFILLAPAGCIFLAVSSKTGFSEHMRYALPAFPYIFISISQFARPSYLTHTSRGVHYKLANCPMRLWVVRSLYIFLVVWFVVSTLWIYPHSLSYFNESVGGPLNGAKHLLGSNVDWGQDLRYLKWWWARNNHGQETFHLAYFGSYSPANVGLAFTNPWPMAAASPSHLLSKTQTNGDLLDVSDKQIFLVGSVNLLFGYPWPARDGAQGASERVDFSNTLTREPSCQIGYSIRSYSIFDRRSPP
jgi:hypothetical protein